MGGGYIDLVGGVEILGLWQCVGINCVFVFVEITRPVNRQVSHRTNQLAGYNEAISNVTVQSLTLFS